MLISFFKTSPNKLQNFQTKHTSATCSVCFLLYFLSSLLQLKKFFSKNYICKTSQSLRVFCPDKTLKVKRARLGFFTRSCVNSFQAFVMLIESYSPRYFNDSCKREMWQFQAKLFDLSTIDWMTSRCSANIWIVHLKQLLKVNIETIKWREAISECNLIIKFVDEADFCSCFALVLQDI